MVNEVYWQTKIIERIRNEGGYGRKWATQYIVGVPDLIVSLNDYGPVFIEVKLEKKWTKNTERTIELTEKQTIELHLLSKASAHAIILLVIWDSPSSVKLVPFFPPPIGEQLRVRRDNVTQGAYKWGSKVELTKYLIKWLHNL